MPNTWQCPKCNKTETNEKNAPPRCVPCNKVMKKITVAAPLTFDDLALKVGTALAAKYQTSYQKKVIDYLKSSAATFKSDFVAEIKKDEDFKKFTGQKERENTKTTNCFDNAIAFAGSALPDGCPVGEKFDFEIPYILNTIQWKYLTPPRGGLFSTTFAEFLAQAKSGYSYLLATRATATSSIGHMITVYMDPEEGRPWLYDPQKLKLPYENYVCEAWESPEEAGSTKKPGCWLDATTGKRDKDWLE